MTTDATRARPWTAVAALALGIALASAQTTLAGNGARSTTRGGRRTALRAHSSASTSVDDTGHLRLLKSYGSVLVEQGSATGTLPGQAKVRMVVGSTVTASFSIATRYGTIDGNGRATLHSTSRYASFGGSLSVSGGSGRYAHARGAGKLYGVIERRSDALTVQTEGQLQY